jgi:hypothetical protein
MSEEQLRDVLARVVPEAPDSVADPAPVVRAARVRRRAQVALTGGAVAVIAVAAVVGGQALTDDDDAGPQVASEVPLSGDPYTAVPCPDVLPESGPMPDLTEVTAIRFCAAGFNGFPAQPGPPDALVYGIDDFEAALTPVPAADPARCAAVDVVPSDSRLVYELADGSLAFTPVTMCTDVDLGDRTADGADVGQVFFAALGSQRYAADYSVDASGTLSCDTPANAGPAQPGREVLVEAMLCPADQAGPGRAIVGEGFGALAEAWSAAKPLSEGEECVAPGPPLPTVVARTDRGDVVPLAANHCGSLDFYSLDLEPAVSQLQIGLDALNAN